MNAEHRFYDYVDSDGHNVIENWLNTEGKNARARFILRIEQLAGSPPGGTEISVWKPPFVKPLTASKWKQVQDFIEIRVKENKKQYRLIGKKLGRDIFLVGWGFHDSKGWNTEITPVTAQERAGQMIDNPFKFRREHGV